MQHDPIGALFWKHRTSVLICAVPEQGRYHEDEAADANEGHARTLHLENPLG